MLLRDVFLLARVSNLPTVWTNVAAAWWLAGGEWSWRLFPVVAGGCLIYAGGCTLNDAFDAEWDRRNRPDRLIPSGRAGVRAVGLLGALELVSGLVLLLLAGGIWPWVPVALAGAVVFYDWRHKDAPWSVLTMGSCRWLLYLAAGAAAMPGEVWRFVAGGGVMFAYIVAVSVIARREAYPAIFPSAGRWVAAMLAGITVLDALLVAVLGSGAWRFAVAAGCAAMFPVCRLLQGKFAAT